MTDKILTAEEARVLTSWERPGAPTKLNVLFASHEALRAALIAERVQRAGTERLLRRAMACLRDVARALPNLVLGEIEKQLDAEAPERAAIGGDDSVGNVIGGSLGVGRVE